MRMSLSKSDIDLFLKLSKKIKAEKMDLFSAWRYEMKERKVVEMSEEEFRKNLLLLVPDEIMRLFSEDFQERFLTTPIPVLVEVFKHSIFSRLFSKSEVTFSIDNLDCSNSWSHVPTGWDPFHSWVVFQAGSDSEVPITGFLYFSSKGLVEYIPETGNIFNQEEKRAMTYEEAEARFGKDFPSHYSIKQMIKETEAASFFIPEAEKAHEKKNDSTDGAKNEA